MTQENKPTFDQAVARRLAKLSTMPVDTTNLDRALRARGTGLPAGDLPSRGTAAPVVRRPSNWQRTLRPISAIAASLILIALVTLALLQDRPVRAEAVVQLHRDLVANKVTTVKVASMDDVNRAFTEFACGAPRITSSNGNVQPRCCCVGKIGNKEIPCLMLTHGQVPVTLALVDTGDVKMPTTPPVTHNGESFRVQSSHGMNLVMVQRGEHTLCVVGDLPAEQLMSLTDGLKF